LKRKQRKKNYSYFPREQDLIANFMSLPGDQAERTARHPVSIESLVEKVWEDWGIGEEETLESVISGNWHKVVGENLSGKCAPIKLSTDGKTLHIRAASSTIKQELGFKRDKILKKINTIRNGQGVTKLRIY
tara:strand:+ start:386 stop:781 length:396 start_codon:yes stop_codon:yes gene_type:complete